MNTSNLYSILYNSLLRVNMYDHITENFAGVLNKRDVLRLFDNLVEKYSGNRSMAARKIGITNAATYQWNDAKYIKTSTKKKILAANFEISYFDTIKFILQRTSIHQTEILRMVLQSLYNEIMQGASREEILVSFQTFMNIKNEYRGVIRDRVEFEFSDMLYNVEDKVSHYGIDYQITIEDFTGKEILDMLPLFLIHYKQNSEDYFTASKLLGVPSEELRKVWNNYTSLRREVQQPVTEAITFGNRAGTEMFTYVDLPEHTKEEENDLLLQITSLGPVAVTMKGKRTVLIDNVVCNNASSAVLPIIRVNTETQDGLCMMDLDKMR